MTFNRKNKIYKWIYNVPELYFKEVLRRNLWRKIERVIERVEVLQNKMIDENLDFGKLVQEDKKEKYYGVCVGMLSTSHQKYTDIY